MLLSYFCYHKVHEVCQDFHLLNVYFAKQLGKSLCECVCHEEEE